MKLVKFKDPANQYHGLIALHCVAADGDEVIVSNPAAHACAS